MNIKQEEMLEWKYQGSVPYVDAKHFLDSTPYTAQKINGAIKRFCNSEGAEKPKTFTEMEPFVNDLADFWLDANPETHTNGEHILHAALSNYIAFSIVWKEKAKSSNIVAPELMAQVGKMLVLKNTLAASTMVINSRLAHDKCPNRELYGDFKTILPDTFFTMLPIINSLQEGTYVLPEGQTQGDLNRLIGGFFAGNPAIIAVSDNLKQIEHKDSMN